MITTPTSAAVIDIGSNSIKLLVAVRGERGEVAGLRNKTLDVRIGTGLGARSPRLSEAGMVAGIEAVRQLLAMAEPFAPQAIALVATSAVRDAENGADFMARVKTSTGHDVRLLDGESEARLIGRGLACDAALSELRDFYVFDLGGGSLECLAFRDRRPEQAVSLPLGAVRLTEKFVADPAAPLDHDALTGAGLHVKRALRESGFRFDLPAEAQAVFTGGAMTAVRLLKAALHGVELEDTPAAVTISAVTSWIDELAPLTLPERRRIPGMPSARADVLPIGLVTMLAVAESARVDYFHHSLRNLRWGVAAELLDIHG